MEEEGEKEFHREAELEKVRRGKGNTISKTLHR